MKKYIERIENLNYDYFQNLYIEKLGHINLFSGKINNGYNSIVTNFCEFLGNARSLFCCRGTIRSSLQNVNCRICISVNQQSTSSTLIQFALSGGSVNITARMTGLTCISWVNLNQTETFRLT